MSDRRKALDNAVLVAYDAFRLCLGHPARHFTADEIVRWIKLLSEAPSSKSDTPLRVHPNNRKTRSRIIFLQSSQPSKQTVFGH